MHALGIYLLYAAVLVRGLVRLGQAHHPGLVVALLALYGLLLVFGTSLLPRLTWWLVHPSTPPRAPPAAEPVVYPKGLLLACLVVQSGLVIGLLLSREVQDFYALLFIPLSIQAVLFLGGRLGFVCIAALTLAMAGPLLASQEGRAFGLAMVLNYGGLCFLLGGYASLIRKAETMGRQNQQVLGELQVAYRQLQGDAAQREELAVEQERNRLARELHDSVTQTVFSMNLTVQSARLLLGTDRDRVIAQIERLEELAASAMREIQVLVSRLRPSAPGLAAEGLPAALRRLADERRAHDGLEVALEVEGERTVPEPVAIALYAIAQEALTNVIKHAGTRQATLHLHLAEGTSFLEVEDNGLGFDTGTAWGRRGHLGLAGMADRARELGWHLSVDSRPGRGTRIRVTEGAPGGAW